MARVSTSPPHARPPSRVHRHDHAGSKTHLIHQEALCLVGHLPIRLLGSLFQGAPHCGVPNMSDAHGSSGRVGAPFRRLPDPRVLLFPLYILAQMACQRCHKHLAKSTLFLPWHSSLCVLDDVTKWAENGTLAKTVAAAVTVTDEMLLGRLRYSRSGLRVRQSCERNPVYARPTTRLCRRHVTSLN